MLKAARSASAMFEEIRSAEDWIGGFFVTWEEDLERYHGPGWRDGGGRKDTAGSEQYDPENFAYEWMTTTAASFVLGNPRARFTTTRTGPERMIVKAHELAVNRWIRDTRMRELNEKLVADFGFRRAICLVLPEQDDLYTDLDDVKGWPGAKRVSPKRYVYDTRAIEKEEELWRGYKTIHRRHELLERATEKPDEHWIVDEIDNLAEDAGVDEIRGRDRGRAGSSRRDEVVLYNIWVRDYKPTKADRKRHGDEAWDRSLRKGAWLTLGVLGNTSAWVRHPFPYWGHVAGPFVLIDGHMIPDEPMGLAPIPAVKAQVAELNVHARALSKAMAKYKKGILVDGSDPELEEKVRGFEDHYVVGIDGLEDIDKKVKEVEFAGATEHHIVHLNLLRERVQRNGGITDIQRGQVDPSVTATADKLADESSQTRTGFVAQKWMDGIREILERVSIYLAFNNTRTALGPEAKRVLRDPKTGKPVEEAVYVGGISSAEEAEWFRSLGLEIEPYSMGQTSEMYEQQRVLQLMNTIAVLLPMMAQFPFVLWDDLIETLGEMMNIPNLSDYFDPEALQQFQQLALQGQDVHAEKGKGQTVQPRLQQDVSRLLSGRQQVGGQSNLLGALLGAMRQVAA